MKLKEIKLSPLVHNPKGLVEISQAIMDKVKMDRGRWVKIPNTPLTFYGYRYDELNRCIPVAWTVGDRDALLKLARLCQCDYIRQVYFAMDRVTPGVKPTYDVIENCRYAWTHTLPYRREYRLSSSTPSNGFQTMLSRMFSGDGVKPSTVEKTKRSRWLAVEVECNIPLAGSILATNRSELAKSFKDIGLWGVGLHGDGSINHPFGYWSIEVILCRRREGFDEKLFKFCEHLNKIGATVNSSCGLHVHFDMRERNEHDVRVLAHRLDSNMLHVVRMLDPTRRDNQYCRAGLSNTDRYRRVNLCAFDKHETLEIRVHQGTTSYDSIMNWIVLLEYLGNRSALNSDRGFRSWFDALELPPKTKEYWRMEAEKYGAFIPVRQPVVADDPFDIPTRRVVNDPSLQQVYQQFVQDARLFSVSPPPNTREEL